MSNIKNSIARSSKSIPYRPELTKITKSVTSAILFQQLLFYAENKNYQPFYKFLEPCLGHPQYTDGDSWLECLQFGRKEFAGAFAHIGVKYKSKTDFTTSKDRFKNKFFACYFDRQTGLTWYYVNCDLVDQELENLYSQKEQKSEKSENTVNAKMAVPEMPKWQFQKCQNGSSYIYTENTTKNTTKSVREPTQEKKEIYHDIVNNPLFELSQATKFPNLTIDEIKLELQIYLADYPRSKFTQVCLFLQEQDQKKIKNQMINNKIRGKPLDLEIVDKNQIIEIDGYTFHTQEEYQDYNQFKKEYPNKTEYYLDYLQYGVGALQTVKI